MLHLKIKAKNEEVECMYANHGTFHEGDSGLDLFVINDQTIKGGETAFVKLGIMAAAFENKKKNKKNNNEKKNNDNNNNDKNDDNINEEKEEKNKKSVSWLILPRSSICRTPLRLANSVGLIDAGYRGEVMAVFDNIKNCDYTIKKGDRLVQAVAFNGQPITYELVDKLDETSRGEGGFGSTDNKNVCINEKEKMNIMESKVMENNGNVECKNVEENVNTEDAINADKENCSENTKDIAMEINEHKSLKNNMCNAEEKSNMQNVQENMEMNKENKGNINETVKNNLEENKMLEPKKQKLCDPLVV